MFAFSKVLPFVFPLVARHISCSCLLPIETVTVDLNLLKSCSIHVEFMLNSCQIQVKFGNIIVQLLIDTYVVALGCNAVAAKPLNYVIFLL